MKKHDGFSASNRILSAARHLFPHRISPADCPVSPHDLARHLRTHHLFARLAMMEKAVATPAERRVYREELERLGAEFIDSEKGAGVLLRDLPCPDGVPKDRFRPHPHGDLVAARVLLGWTQAEAAAACGFKQSYVSTLETGGRVSDRFLGALERAMEDAGIEFLSEDDGTGVFLHT